jgi:hypothetical protein
VKKRAALLLVIGMIQMSGDLLRLPFLKNLGAATAASPAPKVFCAVKGYEAYSTRFLLEWIDGLGVRHSQPFTAESSGRLLGPYNRRNVYGAVLAYGPVLPDRLRSPVLSYALSGAAPVLRELGVDPKNVRSAWIRYEPLPGADMGTLPRVLPPRKP